MEGILVSCVTNTLGISMSDAVRLLYRTRGETQRLMVADVAMRPFFAKRGHSGSYAQWYGAMKRCKHIRNQYAHSSWYHSGTSLALIDFEAAAEAKEGMVALKTRLIDLGLVEEQEALFSYTEDCLWFLSRESRRLRDGRRKHHLQMPKPLPLPRLYNPHN